LTLKRLSGILLHPTSLPGPYGIGDLGPGAYRFIDFLADARCHLWQVLPLGPTGYGDSPYQCFSVFAGNPYLVSPEDLISDGLLTSDDLSAYAGFPSGRVDYGAVIPRKLAILDLAFQRYLSDPTPELRAAFVSFQAANVVWLDDYALFMAVKEIHGGGAWDAWPRIFRKRQANALGNARRKLANLIKRQAFYQFLFYRQWQRVRAYARQRGIQIVGDVPIFAAYDSADVWSHPNLFRLDEDDKPTVVAGVPPDYFSQTGQLWGNPIYDWEVHKKDGYAWWKDRMRAALGAVDIIRLDHFRGFASYWEIPAGRATAEIGRWTAGPGADLFDALVAGLQDSSWEDLPLIAEDLGVITPDVVALRERYHLPGMKIIQFGFSDPESPYLPHHYPPNCVAYTGTHDNDTARGWFESANDSQRAFALRYLQTDEINFTWDLMRAVWNSNAAYAIAPMQDLLDLGNEARMNYPGRPGGNWAWRMQENELSDGLSAKMRDLNDLYRR
jgi:4-alpha-glucanotransferase